MDDMGGTENEPAAETGHHHADAGEGDGNPFCEVGGRFERVAVVGESGVGEAEEGGAVGGEHEGSVGGGRIEERGMGFVGESCCVGLIGCGGRGDRGLSNWGWRSFGICDGDIFMCLNSTRL